MLDNAAPMMENRTFDEITIGESASLSRRLTRDDIKLFAVMSGDSNPAHLDDGYAKETCFHEVIAHGMWGGSLISTVLGTQLPGPGTIYLDQTLSFQHPVMLGDTLNVTITVKEKCADKQTITFDCLCSNQAGDTVISGEALVRAPCKKIQAPSQELPKVRLMERHHLNRILESVQSLPPLKTAVVHPTSYDSLAGAVDAAHAGIIEPILVGPLHKIEAVAEEHGIDLNGLTLEEVPHSHAAAQRAVELVHERAAQSLMKGSLHTDELLHAVLHKQTGLRTDKRISHAFVFDVPTYPNLLLISDAAINIHPGLPEKADIVQNTVDFARAIGIEQPKVAILSAIETVTPKIQSTLEAAALCKMADRGQITGAIIDGPLAFDNAISAAAAKTKGIDSPVSGQADILIAPDLESGNMLAKQLEYLADAKGAGLLLGARVPIVLTSRADDAMTRMISCALAARLHAGAQSA